MGEGWTGLTQLVTATQDQPRSPGAHALCLCRIPCSTSHSSTSSTRYRMVRLESATYSGPWPFRRSLASSSTLSPSWSASSFGVSMTAPMSVSSGALIGSCRTVGGPSDRRVLRIPRSSGHCCCRTFLVSSSHLPLPFGTGRKTASGVNAQGTVEYRSAARICRESPCAEGNGAYSHQVRKATELPRRGVASLMNGRRRRTP
jgi:hypothetical protein